MTHLPENELLDAYYGDLPEAGREHLGQCPVCRDALAQLAELLDGVREAPVPERNDSYGREVWARLEPKLPSRHAHWWFRPWIVAPAAAALLAIAFLGGMLTMHLRQPVPVQSAAVTNRIETNGAGISEKDSQRVLLGAMSDHLDRSEVLLAQLLHASPEELNSADQRARARDLLDENRLLRQTATRSGDQGHAALLDDLERVLLDIANSPAQLSSADVAELRRRVENQSLLFKVRVSSTDARTKGRTL